MNVHIIGPLPCNDLKQVLKAQGGPTNSTFIFVDGGIQHMRSIPDLTEKSSTNIDQVVWLGDHDGVSKEIYQQGEDFLKELARKGFKVQKIDFNPHKDQSDLALALSWIAQNGPQSLSLNLYGFIGGRLDHQLAVLGEINEFARAKPFDQINLFDDTSLKAIEVLRGKNERNHKGQLSLLSPEPQMVTLKGNLKYSGEVSLKNFSSLGLSNEAMGNFQVTCDLPLFLFYL